MIIHWNIFTGSPDIYCEGPGDVFVFLEFDSSVCGVLGQEWIKHQLSDLLCSWPSTRLQPELRSHHLLMLYFAPSATASTLCNSIHPSSLRVIMEHCFQMLWGSFLRHHSLQNAPRFLLVVKPRVIGWAGGFLNAKGWCFVKAGVSAMMSQVTSQLCWTQVD